MRLTTEDALRKVIVIGGLDLLDAIIAISLSAKLSRGRGAAKQPLGRVPWRCSSDDDGVRGVTT